MRAAIAEAVARAPSGGGGGVRAARGEGKRSEQRKGEARVDQLNGYAGGYENRPVRKKLYFWRKHSSLCDFHGYPLFPTFLALTGGSDVRDMTDPLGEKYFQLFSMYR